MLETVTVRHYTSRAGDPHRHLHLQINARVFAEGQWRGLHTLGVRDSLTAINGIGHRGLHRAWDVRAWADGRPDKVVPEQGAHIHGRCSRELVELGCHDRDKPIALRPTTVGAVDRGQTADVCWRGSRSVDRRGTPLTSARSSN